MFINQYQHLNQQYPLDGLSLFLTSLDIQVWDETEENIIMVVFMLSIDPVQKTFIFHNSCLKINRKQVHYSCLIIACKIVYNSSLIISCKVFHNLCLKITHKRWIINPARFPDSPCKWMGTWVTTIDQKIFRKWNFIVHRSSAKHYIDILSPISYSISHL